MKYALKFSISLSRFTSFCEFFIAFNIFSTKKPSRRTALKLLFTVFFYMSFDGFKGFIAEIMLYLAGIFLCHSFRNPEGYENL